MSDEMFDELSEELARSWKAHTDAFPLLNNAFTEDIPTRIHLTAALNHISNRVCGRGIEILGEIEERCICDDDRCAWLFCMALAYEMSGQQENTVSYYYQCCQYSPDFYWPYLKVAKSAHINQNFSLARDFYKKALRALSGQNMIEASAASNLASCYTMMHDYPMAALMLDYSSKAMSSFPGRSGCYAVLYAAMGEQDKAKEQLEALQNEHPAIYAPTHKMVKEILCGSNPHFCVLEPDRKSISAFLTSFTNKEKLFREQLDQGNDTEICEFISDIMSKAFSFMEKKLRVRANKDEFGYTVELTDYYSISLTYGYNELISDLPDDLKAYWNFKVVHD